jgi:hypothetical protein
MTRRTVSIGLLFLGVMAIAVFGVAQDAPTEAPAGFETFTLVENPGSQSHSNGIPEPVAGDTYAIDQTSTNKRTIQPQVLAPCTMRAPVPIATRIPSAAAPASSPNCASAIST